MTADRGHVATLDVTRGLAALAVTMLHVREINWVGMRAFAATHGFEFSPLALMAYATLPIAWGSIGVPIFFVLSGYVIHRGSKGRMQTRRDVFRFLSRRFIRIYPVFLAAMLLTAVLDLWSKGHVAHPKLGDTSLFNAALNALAVVGFVGSPYGSNVALWSLPLEIQSYLLYPVGLIAWRKLGSTPMMLIAVALNIAGIWLQEAAGITCCLAYFASWWLGAYVADREHREVPLRWQWWGGWLIIAAGCAACSLRYLFVAQVAWSLGFAAILEVMIRQPPPLQAGRVIRALALCGAFSYSLYAVHMPVSVAFNAALLNGTKQDDITWSLVALVPALCAAYLFYLIVERPCLNLMRHLRTDSGVEPFRSASRPRYMPHPHRLADHK
jgi:peptidoglycan/LPS O-acetylase OafA/YrhL